MKSLEYRLSCGVEDSLAAELGKEDFEREANECYNGFVVKSRLERVPNKAVKCNEFVCDEEFQKVPTLVY